MEVEQLNSDKSERKKALLIAVSKYDDQDVEDLGFCENDGNEMAKLLNSLGYEIPNQNILIGNVTGNQLQDSIIDFFSDPLAKPEDTLLFYYSGHGMPDSEGDVYLSSSEINPDLPMRRGFSFDQFTKTMRNATSVKIVSVLDCCYSGAAKLAKGQEEAAARLGRSAIDDKSKKLTLGGGKYILSASQAAQEAYALVEGDHSIFTYFLIDGLQGANGESVDSQGNVTPESLGRYVYRAIMSLPPDRRPKQTPVTRAEESGDIILAHHPDLIPLKGKAVLEKLSQFLREGNVEEFNKLRLKNSDMKLDFSNENLYAANMSNVDLSNGNLLRIILTKADMDSAKLTNANLFKADLEGASLTRANLSNAELESANLSKADLSKADLSKADLSKADLSDANLFGANLEAATLIGANLRGANLHKCNLNGADLRGAIFEFPQEPAGVKDMPVEVKEIEKPVEVKEMEKPIEKKSYNPLPRGDHPKTVKIDRPGDVGAPLKPKSYQLNAIPTRADQVNEISSTIGKETKVTVRRYVGRMVPLEKFADDLVSYLKGQDFKVDVSKMYKDYPLFIIEAKKSGKIKKIIGSTRSALISIRGSPDDFEVSLAIGNWKKNVISSVSASLPVTIPLGIVTFGISYIPAIAAAGMAGMGSIYGGKRFKDHLWEVIEHKIVDFKNS